MLIQRVNIGENKDKSEVIIIIYSNFITTKILVKNMLITSDL